MVYVCGRRDNNETERNMYRHIPGMHKYREYECIVVCITYVYTAARWIFVNAVKGGYAAFWGRVFMHTNFCYLRSVFCHTVRDSCLLSCMIRPEVMRYAVFTPPPASKFAAVYRDGGVYREEIGTFPPPQAVRSLGSGCQPNALSRRFTLQRRAG